MPAYRLITGYNLAVHGIEVDRGVRLFSKTSVAHLAI
jgi:hypothetical protein